MLATKVGARRDAEGGWPPALSPDQLTEDVHANLTELAHLEENLAVAEIELESDEIKRLDSAAHAS